MIKEFVDRKNNIMLSKMSNDDKAFYLSFLSKYLIEYRKTLNIDPDNTFGIEVEYEALDKEYMDEYVDEMPGWKSVYEKDFILGGEVVSPILKDYYTNWIDVKEILDKLSSYDSVDVDHHSGSHVHIGADIFKDFDSFCKFLLLYVPYEGIIYRFGYMDKVNPRESLVYSAPPSCLDIARKYDDIVSVKTTKHLHKIFGDWDNRFTGLNFQNIKSFKKKGINNTIEFRMANGTTSPILWQNTINFYIKLIQASFKDLDIDRLAYILYRMKNSMFNTEGFDIIDIDKAMELADIVFDNMLDKTNFMKQYYKDGSQTKISYSPCYTKKLTKE